MQSALAPFSAMRDGRKLRCLILSTAELDKNSVSGDCIQMKRLP